MVNPVEPHDCWMQTCRCSWNKGALHGQLVKRSWFIASFLPAEGEDSSMGRFFQEVGLSMVCRCSDTAEGSPRKGQGEGQGKTEAGLANSFHGVADRTECKQEQANPPLSKRNT